MSLIIKVTRRKTNSQKKKKKLKKSLTKEEVTSDLLKSLRNKRPEIKRKKKLEICKKVLKNKRQELSIVV